LSSITLSIGEIEDFSPDKTEYEIVVPYGTESATVFAESPLEGKAFTYEPSVTVALSGAPGEKTASVQIGVIALNRSMAFYTVVFTEAPPLQSFLAGVEISGGLTLADEDGPAVFDPARKEYTIAVPASKQDVKITVNAIKERFSDSVRFSGDVTDGANTVQPPFFTEDGVSKILRLSVNHGPGFADETYAFSFSIKPEAPAALAALTSNIGTLYKRTADGAKGQEGFSSNHYSYTLVVPNETAAVSLRAEAKEAEAEDEADGSVFSGAAAAEAAPYVSLTVQNPRASSAPAQFTVSAGPYSAPSVYTVYFDTLEHPPAILSRVSISGGTIVDNDFSSDVVYYDVRVYSSAPSLIINAAADDPFEVRYIPKNVFAPPVEGIFYITASGGPDYTDTIYSFNVDVVQAQSPRLKTVSVNGSSLALETDVMTYEKTIPYGTGGSVYADVSWSVDVTEVSRVAYSFDGGSSWEDDPEKNGFSGALSISPAQTKTVLVKVTAFDDNLSIYFLSLTREGNGGANLVSLSYNCGAGDVPITLSTRGGVTEVQVPCFATNLTMSAAKGPNLDETSGQVSASPTSFTWSSQEDATPKVAQVKAKDNDGANETYNLIFLKKSKTATAMALGGEVSFIKNTDNSWDELHIFKERGNSTLSFQAGRFKNPLTGKVLVVAGGGGGGAGGGGGDDSGGGGGGGVAYTEAAVNLSGYFTDGTANITVGAGGAAGSNGEDSFFSTAQAIGGGAGGHSSSTEGGFAGGSGGGGGGGPYSEKTNGGAALIQNPKDPNFKYYGNAGGGDNNGGSSGGGGGGAGAAGEDASAGGKGGTYKTIDITGSAVNYSQGGNSGNVSGMGSAIGSGGQGCANGNILGSNPSKTATSGKDGVVVVRFRYSE
jgi:hypothetical protein